MTVRAQRAGNVVDDRGDRVGLVAWSAGGALLCWLGALHLGVVLSFAFGFGVSPASRLR